MANIADLVIKEGCDLIAMATHGHHGMMDWLMGSVADGLRHKTCTPILVVRGAKLKDLLPTLKKKGSPL